MKKIPVPPKPANFFQTTGFPPPPKVKNPNTFPVSGFAGWGSDKGLGYSASFFRFTTIAERFFYFRLTI